MRILVVTGNLRTEVIVSNALRRQKRLFEIARSLEESLEKMQCNNFEAIIFDATTAEWVEFDRRVSSDPENAPLCSIIISEISKAGLLKTAIEKGATDFIIQPFSSIELQVRLASALSRAPKSESPHSVLQLNLGPLVLDVASQRIYAADMELVLTPRERSVLSVLIEQQDIPITKKKLAKRVFSLNDDVQPRAVETYVHRLRKKLAPHRIGIINERGLGYRLDIHQAL